MAERSAKRELEDLDEIFTALAHASRRQILLTLHFRGGEMTAGEIASRFDCTWPTISRHLAQLVSAGLVRAERRGRERVYSLDRARLERIAGGWLRHFAR